MNNRITYFFAIMVILLLPTLANAQPGFGDDVSDVPVDGGLSVLVAAGVGYACKKYKAGKINKN
jgi:hypothetical protein